MKYINYNIDNLLNLWTTVSKPFKGHASDTVIGYSQIQSSEWPNKIWSTQKLTSEILNNIQNLINESQINLRFVDFTYKGRTNKKRIEDFGFELTSSLPGMSLELTKSTIRSKPLNFLMVTNAHEARIWCDIFYQSFGYVISQDIVIKTMYKVHFYIAFKNKTPVGVIKLHLTNNVAGIYSLGVPVQFRGKGYAKDIMHFILNYAYENDATVATLQASKLAENMYKDLGFQKDFIMNNYKFKTQ